MFRYWFWVPLKILIYQAKTVLEFLYPQHLSHLYLALLHSGVLAIDETDPQPEFWGEKAKIFCCEAEASMESMEAPTLLQHSFALPWTQVAFYCVPGQPPLKNETFFSEPL